MDLTQTGKQRTMRTPDRRINRRSTRGRWPRALALWLVALVLGLGSSGDGWGLWAQEGERCLKVGPPAPASSDDVEIKGDYRALLIGIDEYHDENIPDLGSAGRDVKAVRDVLQKRYGFKEDHVTLLLDNEATEGKIEEAFKTIVKQAKAENSVFIYYAGHGEYDKDVNEGWWVPHNGSTGKTHTLFLPRASLNVPVSRGLNSILSAD